jgi:hypothetical protein
MWQHRAAAAWQNFRVVANLRPSVVAFQCSYNTERNKGSLDYEGSTQKWSVDGAHRRGKLGSGGGFDSGAGGVLQ